MIFERTPQFFFVTFQTWIWTTCWLNELDSTILGDTAIELLARGFALTPVALLAFRSTDLWHSQTLAHLQKYPKGRKLLDSLLDFIIPSAFILSLRKPENFQSGPYRGTSVLNLRKLNNCIWNAGPSSLLHWLRIVEPMNSLFSRCWLLIVYPN